MYGAALTAPFQFDVSLMGNIPQARHGIAAISCDTGTNAGDSGYADYGYETHYTARDDGSVPCSGGGASCAEHA